MLYAHTNWFISVVFTLHIPFKFLTVFIVMLLCNSSKPLLYNFNSEEGGGTNFLQNVCSFYQLPGAMFVRLYSELVIDV